MATFTKITELAEHKAYMAKLKVALPSVKVGVNKAFIYYQTFPFATDKQAKPLLLVDYLPTVVQSLPKGLKATPIKGEVTRNEQEELVFLPATKEQCVALQAMLSKLPETVFIPADAADAAAPAPGAKPAAKTSLPGANAGAKPAAVAPGTFPVPQKPVAKVGLAPAKVASVPPKTPVSGNVAPAPAGNAPAPRNTATPPGNAATPPVKAATPRVGLGQSRVAPPPAKKAVTPPAANPARPKTSSDNLAEQPKTEVTPEKKAALEAAKAQALRDAGMKEKMAALSKEVEKCKKRVQFLRQRKWVDTTDAEKEAQLKEIESDLARCDANDIDTIKLAIDTLTAKKLDQSEPTWTAIHEVDKSFLIPAQRLNEGSKLTEELEAMIALVKLQTAGTDKEKDGQAIIESLGQVKNKGGSVMAAAKSCIYPAEMKVLFQQFEAVQKEKKALALKIRPMWIEDQKSRYRKELTSTTQSISGKMLLNMPEEEFFEMARMSETMAKKSAKGFDPYKGHPDMNPLQPMLMGEVAALYGYSTQDFSTINAIKRGNKKNPSEDKDLPPDAPKTNFQPYMDACTSALNKLPVFKGTVYRCDRNLPDIVINELLKSGTRTDPAFVSTGLQMVPGFGEIVSVISGIKTGREMTMFSLHEGEGEVLFTPGAVFKLTEFEDTAGLKGEKGKKYSDLKKFSPEDLRKLTKGVFHFKQKS